MKVIKLTSKTNGKPIYFIINNRNISMYRSSREDVTIYQDGNHNNGGWRVVETPEEIIELIKKAEEI